MKKTIREYALKGKKVIIRTDFNVPIENGCIIDDNRIIQSLETIKYAVENGAKVILLSHLGRIKTEEDLRKNDLYPVSIRLCEYLSKTVTFVNKTRGKEVEEAINHMQEGDIVLLQNTRFEDLSGKKESSNDSSLGSYWASLGDIFINDAFGTVHRAHASNVGIATHLPNGIGFLIEKELRIMGDVIDHPRKPFAVILGGSKVSDKIGVIEHFVHICDYLLIGGGMAYTFLKAKGIPTGKSIIDEEHLSFCKDLLNRYPDTIILPIDTINATEIGANVHTERRFIEDTEDHEMGLDIGHTTVKVFSQYLMECKTIFWNGPVGMFELKPFEEGTKDLCKMISTLQATTIIGGGDTASAVKKFGYQDQMTHISTGGGASLELLEGKKLPGIDAIEDI